MRVLMHCASLHKRRNLTADQRAMVGACVAERWRVLTKARQVEAGREHGRGQVSASDADVAEDDSLVQTEAKLSDGQESEKPKRHPRLEKNKTQPAERKASALAAKEVGTSRSAVERAAAIRRVDPALADRVTSGEMKLKQAERVAKAPPEIREQMASQLETAPVR